jgi:hypothetical protein
MFFEVLIHLTRLRPNVLSGNSQRFEEMFTYKFVPDDVAGECSECVHELCFVHGLRLYENCGLLIVLFRVISGFAPVPLNVRYQPWEFVANLFGEDDDTSQRRLIAAAIGLEDGRLEIGN